MSAAFDTILEAITSGDAGLPTVLQENWPCLTQDEKSLVGVLNSSGGSGGGGGGSSPEIVPGPLSGLDDPRGGVGSESYYANTLYKKVSVSPHTWWIVNAAQS